MAMVIEQDHFRQKIVAQKGEEARQFTQKLIHNMINLGLESGRDVITMRSDAVREMIARVVLVKANGILPT